MARPVLELLFPSGSNSRILVFAVTGINGKSTTCRMPGHILQHAGAAVGLTSTTGIYLNNDRIVSGDCSGPQSARMILREPSVEMAMLECARGGILREGLGFDECDVGAVLNVSQCGERPCGDCNGALPLRSVEKGARSDEILLIDLRSVAGACEYP